MLLSQKFNGGLVLTRSDLKDGDSLYFRVGGGFNYEPLHNLKLNATLLYDIFLYSKSVSNNKVDGFLDSYSEHGPSLFLGINYAFFTR